MNGDHRAHLDDDGSLAAFLAPRSPPSAKVIGLGNATEQILVSVSDELGGRVRAAVMVNGMTVDERTLRPFIEPGHGDDLAQLHVEITEYRAALGHYHIVATLENHRKAILHFVTAVEHFFGREAADVVRVATNQQGE